MSAIIVNMKQKSNLIVLLIAVFGSLIFIATTFAESDAETHAETHSAWMTDFEAAKAKAKAENKPILVDFTGSDWCVWCIKLDKEVFSKKAFLDYASSNFVLVEIDFPSKKVKQSAELKAQNEALSEKYDIKGFPTILILDADGKVIERTGYQSGGAQNYVEHLKEILAGGEK